MSNWQRFGDPSRFAIDIEFLPDPHNGRGASPAQAASWGAFRLWVRGRNLCEHRARDALHDAATWYLLPFLTWLAENWDPLFHEQRLPEAMQPKSARHAYLGAVRATLGDPDPHVEHRAIAWQQWCSVMACGRAAKAACFRTSLSDACSISRSSPGVIRTCPEPRETSISPHPLTRNISMWRRLPNPCTKPSGWRSTTWNGRVSEERRKSPHSGTASPASQQHRRCGARRGTCTAVPMVERDTDLRAILERSAAKASGEAMALFESNFCSLYLEHLSPAVVMFGSASLSIGQADADFLAQRLLNAYAPDGEPDELMAWRRVGFDG